MPQTNPPSLLHKPIAIVGMACRLPGADNLEEYWDLLREGRSAVEELPADRLDRSLYFDPEKGVRGKTYSTIGGLVSDRPVDPEVCLLSGAEQQNVDPCHLIMCEVVCKACLNAGYDIRDMPLRNTGVYIGHSGGSTLGSDMVYGTLAAETAAILAETPSFQQLPLAEQQGLQAALISQIRAGAPCRNADGSPELDASAVASLVSRVLGLTGPHMVTDAACASSVVSLVMGSLAVQSGQVDMALVGGASYSKAGSLILFSQAQSCSATGSRPFDDDADGLVSSEGYVALAIKTLDRALADGDSIQAVISGLGLSADGRGRSLWAPRKEGQAAAMGRAYSEQVRAEDVQYIEAHATSTQIGDATEMEALAGFYQSKFEGRRVPVGSVKSNIGHTLETAGLASLLKTVLAIQHKVMPPTIHLEKPNEEIPWNEIPFEVLSEARPWAEPAEGKVRRAGVNAFGIGGLNVHAVVDEFSAAYHGGLSNQSGANRGRAQVDLKKEPACPLAIIGRGLVLPGANNVSEFAELLASQKSQIVEAPADRWLDRDSVRDSVMGGNAQPWQTPTCRGGFIRDYAFDWKRHRIPPKQIANANPLQFMLLDAAHQAFDESGYAEREFDRSRTAVVVGTLFGGEFGHQLVVGLRMEELKRDLLKLFVTRNFSSVEGAQLVEEFVEQFLKTRPALIDETGSFTSSTLASRISKELNFMGGAMAVDAGDCSSFAALDVARNLLRSGACSQILCAGAQRSMDLANYEALALQGRLHGSKKTQDGFVPGEGAAAVLLKRLDDAQRDGDRILGVIHDVAGATDSGQIASAIADAGNRLSANGAGQKKQIVAGCNVVDLDEAEQSAFVALHGAETPISLSRSIPQIGHTMAAYGMVETICSTLEEGQLLQIVSGYAPDGQAYQIALSGLAALDQQKSVSQPPAVNMLSTDSVSTSPASAGQIVRFQAESADGLDAALRQALDAPTASSGTSFSAKGTHRLAILFQEPVSFRQQVELALKTWRQPAARVALTKKNVFLGTEFLGNGSSERPRTAFVFTGQGSQYPGMFADLPTFSPAAKAVLDEANGYLVEIGGKTYEQLSGVGSRELGSDIWATQASLLVADLMTMAWLEEMGVRADCICGHSFGEYAALCAAGSCSLEQILRITRHRTLALEANIDQRGALVSLHAPVAMVEELIRRGEHSVSITHRNAPEQTVVGGTYQAVAQFSEFAEEAGIAGHLLSVPCAFHTSLMVSAQQQFKQALQQETLLPVSTPLLSSVTNRYLADPGDLRENLVRQMVEPVCYLEMIERLSDEGVKVFIEIGPQQVLTRLNGQILAGREHVCVAVDEPKQTPASQTLRMQAQLECLGMEFMQRPRSRVSGSLLTQRVTLQPVAHFDATAKRKQGMRTRSKELPQQVATASPAALEEFDATRARRQRTAASAQSQPLTTTQPAAKSPVPSGDGLEQFLVDFIVEQTGYPPEIIELDWDLEADLGIDSIKKAQLFGELRELFDFESTLDPKMASQLTLDQFTTLRSILELLEQSGGKGEWLETGKQAVLPQSIASESTGLALQNGASDLPADLATIAPSDGLEAFLIDFVVEQTGYPPEIIELDAQFEADLGIDSIKKAQLFGELREHFQLEVDSSGRLSLADFVTLRDVLKTLGQMIDEQQGNESTDPIRPPEVPAGRADAPLTSRAVSAVEGLLSAPVAEPLAEVNGVARNGAAKSLVRERSPVGRKQGELNRTEIHEAVYKTADRFSEASGTGVVESKSRKGLQRRFSEAQWQDLERLAEGAGLSIENVAAHEHAKEKIEQEVVSIKSKVPSVTTRRVLTVQRLSQQENVPDLPHLTGAALVVGTGPVAEEFERRLRQLGRPVYRIEETGDAKQVVRRFQEIWKREAVPHLFFVGPREAEAKTSFDEAAWQERRERGVMSPFWLCQSWIKQVTDAGLADEATLVATLSLGGDFGTSGEVVAAESGGVAGLLKAMIIENWMNGIRTLPIKLIDAPATESSESVVDSALRELAVPSYDCETSWSAGVRQVIRAVPRPLAEPSLENVRRGGNWIFTGGARGITAHVAFKLAKRYQLKLHLLGTAPLPQIDLAQRNLDAGGLKQLKIEVMTTARQLGESPIKAWEKQEKALEIDATLAKFAEAGISATYYSCDVADRDALGEVLDEIRRTSGSIDAIVHGAGVGKDSRFENKQPEKVEQCIRAKVDGALALMALTRDDPLQFFVGFGSISGRFGANGHADYSLANEMLAKVIGWYRRQRPEVGSVAFHWHAWGDVGMATKPETRLALEMIDMQFMPAAEGVQHLINELEAGAPVSEVLITDDRYCRMFFPAESVVDSQQQEDREELFPLLDRGESSRLGQLQVHTFSLDPQKDPFLSEHRLDDRPLLPIVAGLEMLYEAAAKYFGGKATLRLTDIQATNGLRFYSDRKQVVRVTSEMRADGLLLCELRSDFCTRDGRLVEADRLYLSCSAEVNTSSPPEVGASLSDVLSEGEVAFD